MAFRDILGSQSHLYDTLDLKELYFSADIHLCRQTIFIIQLRITQVYVILFIIKAENQIDSKQIYVKNVLNVQLCSCKGAMFTNAM